MTRPLLLAALLAPLGLSACIVPIPVPNGTPGSIQYYAGDPCGARSIRRQFQGQPEAALHAVTFAGPTRIVHPGEAVTEEVQDTRITFRIGPDGTVASVECG